jgi:hypothetical protein
MAVTPPLPRASWLRGGLVLAAAAGVALALGLVLGAASWRLYIGLFVGGVLLAGWAEDLWTRRRRPAPRKIRTKLKVIQGGKHDYDLADDDSTDNQRYLM